MAHSYLLAIKVKFRSIKISVVYSIYVFVVQGRIGPQHSLVVQGRIGPQHSLVIQGRIGPQHSLVVFRVEWVPSTPLLFRVE